MTQLSLCHTAMRWNSRRAFYRPAQEPIDPNRFSVAPVGDTAARDFVITLHYSGSYPAAIAAYAIFERIASDNHAYVFPCGTRATRQEIRRRMDKGLPRPTRTDLSAAA